MEWVETTGRTVEEAKARALDQLSVAEDDAEFELLDEPRAGLFGRLRGEARVRARVRPTQPRPKQERRDRKKGRGDAAEGGKSSGAATSDAAPSATTAVLDDEPVDTVQAGPPPAKKSNGGQSSGKGRRGGGKGDAPAARQTNDEVNGSEHKENPVDAQQVGDEAQKFVQGLVDAFGLTGTASLRRD